MNFVSYHKRTRLLKCLEDNIEVGDFSDFSSPYYVFLPQDELNFLLSAQLYTHENEPISFGDFYQYVNYKSTKSITRILTQLVTGVRDSLSFSKGSLSDMYSFNFVLRDVLFSSFLIELKLNGELFGYIKLVLVPPVSLSGLYHEFSTRQVANILTSVVKKNYSNREELTNLGNQLYLLSKENTQLAGYRTEL